MCSVAEAVLVKYTHPAKAALVALARDCDAVGEAFGKSPPSKLK
jgi:hypothetical protein